MDLDRLKQLAFIPLRRLFFRQICKIFLITKGLSISVCVCVCVCMFCVCVCVCFCLSLCLSVTSSHRTHLISENKKCKKITFVDLPSNGVIAKIAFRDLDVLFECKKC